MMNWTWYEGPEGVWMLLPENGSTPYARIEPRKDYKTTVYICDISTVNVNRHFLVQRWEMSDSSTVCSEVETRMRAMGFIRQDDAVVVGFRGEAVKRAEVKEQTLDPIELVVYTAIDKKSDREEEFLADMRDIMSNKSMEGCIYRWALDDATGVWELREIVGGVQGDLYATVAWSPERGGRALARTLWAEGWKKRRWCKSAPSAVEWIEGQVSIWDSGAAFVYGGELDDKEA